MAEICTNTLIFQYADDTVLMAAAKSVDLCTEIIQRDFDRLVQWTRDLNLKINFKKTAVTHIRPPRSLWNKINVKVHTSDCLHLTIPIKQFPRGMLKKERIYSKVTNH